MITHNDVKYVIVQAGGKGTRLGKYTMNKPKCLVPVHGKPMIKQTLDIYKNKKVIIIGDTHFKILSNYINYIIDCDNCILYQTDEEGTSAGIKFVLENIPDDEPFIITWSDLFFEKEQQFSFNTELLVGIAGNFDCRWSLRDGVFENISSQEIGVSGFFVFKNKKKFEKIKTDKSLVRGFLSENYFPSEISSFINHDCFEVGTCEKYEEILNNEVKHRFFNKVILLDNKIHKKCIDLKYKKIHESEKNWYNYVKNSFTKIPKIYSTDPLIMSKIDGKHAWEIEKNKDFIIKNYCDALEELHSIQESFNPISNHDCMDTYFFKPYQRVMEVKHIIEDFYKPVIEINGKKCKNPFCDIKRFEEIIEKYLLNDIKYSVIHGDCTFSNTLIDDKNQIWFIDPRGTFGKSEIYGDFRYDWVKFYYSAIGNYDKINSKKFVVDRNNQINISIDTNGYEHFDNYILQRSGVSELEMTLLHMGVWFSLSGYVKEDIDAILYSFYKGCQLWTKAITLI